MRRKRLFQHLSWLVFLGYLLFGLGGGLAAVCCSDAGAAVCVQVHEQAPAAPCLSRTADAGSCCPPCYNHHPGPDTDRAHLLPQGPTFRSVGSLAFLVPSATQWTSRQPEMTGFGLGLSGPQRNPALKVIRSTVLLL